MKKFNVYVAIGSSAGGFEALSELVTCLPQKTGFFYFLAQHHARAQKSVLAELLGRKSTIAVTLAKEGMLLKPDMLYVFPPELKILIVKNKPTLVKAELNLPFPLPSADFLFSELCAIKDSKVIAILLSGTGSDGTKGMKVVKESGGVTIAQDPRETMFDGMSTSAINSDMVDYVLSVTEIGDKLSHLSIRFNDDAYVNQENPFISIVKLLHNAKGLDLSRYKEETINRRVEKRMTLLRLETIEEYSRYLKSNSQEIDFLYQEVLIGVTEFFRGVEAFEALKNAVREKFISLEEYSEFRVWSVACSSGEEAYTIAIILSELSRELDKTFYFKIFASDIDDVSLEKARLGEYKTEAFSHMDKELFARYFVKNEHGYKVVQALRDLIVFARHNFLNNPPFINMDLISCRNVLIYLKRFVQKDVFALFHHSLKSDGTLFLGLSESILNGSDYFNALDNKNRIYKKSTHQKNNKFSLYSENKYLIKSPSAKEKKMAHPITPLEIEKYLHEELFAYCKSESLIVDDNFTIVYKKGEIPYLHFSDGMISLNLFNNLDKNLHFEARAVLNRVLTSNMREKSKFVQLESSNDEKFARLIAQPFHMPSQGRMILVNFQKVELKELFLNINHLPSFGEDSLVSNLSSQLQESEKALQNISNELLFSKQNMATINEELQDSNEKLQSTVEELETSNEELQSSNEELIASLASNRELQNRLSLILESSMDGILGIDMQARHTFVNDRAAQLLGYSAEYLMGKDSHQVWHHTKEDGSYYPQEECPILKTLRKGEVSRGKDLLWREDGTSFPVELIRSPIMEEGVITGAVISFHDITKEESLSNEIENTNFKYEQTFQAAQIGMAHVGLDGSWLDVNAYLCRLLGYSKKELLELTFQEITHADDLDKDLEYVHDLLAGKRNSYHKEKRYIRKNGNVVWINLSVILLRDAANEPLYFISIVQDISQVKMLMFELELKKNDLENIIRFAPNPILLYDEDGKILLMNEVFQDSTGYAQKEIKNIEDLNKKILMDEEENDVNQNIFLTSDVKIQEKIVKTVTTKDHKELSWIYSISALANIQNGKKVFIASFMDITEIQKKEELMLAQSRQAAMGDMVGMIAHQWRQPLTVISMYGNNLRADLELDNEITKKELYSLTEALNEQTQSLSQTIEDFRTFLKPEKEKEKISLCKFYEKLRNMIQKTLENNEVALSFSDDCDMEFYTYPNEFLQVFINLLNNSKDAIKERKIENGAIHIDTIVKKDILTIEVKDNAGGIDADVVHKLGEPYVSTKKKNGTGLGIYMSRMILEKHFNGNLSWKNYGDGSCFTITLPLSE